MAMVAAVSFFHDCETNFVVNSLELMIDDLIERLRAHYGRRVGERLLRDRVWFRSIRLADHVPFWHSTRLWFEGRLHALELGVHELGRLRLTCRGLAVLEGHGGQWQVMHRIVSEFGERLASYEEELLEEAETWDNSPWRGPGVMVVSVDGRLMNWLREA